MSKYNKFVKDIILMSISTFLVGFQGVLLLPILTKNLGAFDYGIWSQIKITLSFIGPIVFFGLKSALIRFLTGETNQKKINQNVSSIFYFITISSIIFSLMMFLFSKSLSLFLLKTTAATLYFQIASVLILLQSLSGMFVPILRIKEKYNLVSLSKIIFTIFTILIVFLLLTLNFKIYGVILGFIISEILFILILFISSKKIFSFVKPSFKVIKKNLIYGFPLTFVPLFQWVFQVGDQYLLGYFQGAKIVGIYSLAYSLAYILLTITTPIFHIIQTSITKAWNEKNMVDFRLYFKFSYKYLFLILIPASFGIIFLAGPMIRILSTPEFSDSAKILPLLVIGFLLYTLIIFSNNILRLENKTKNIRNLFIFLAVSNLILNSFLIPLYSLYGAAIATLITFLFSAIYSIYVIKKQKISLMPLFITKSIFASSVMSVFILYARSLNMVDSVKTGFIIIISVFIYFSLMFILKTFEKKELIFLRNLIIKRKNI